MPSCSLVLHDLGKDQTPDLTLCPWQSVQPSLVSFLFGVHSQCYDYEKNEFMPSCSHELHDLLQLSQHHFSERAPGLTHCTMQFVKEPNVLSLGGTHSQSPDYAGDVFSSSCSQRLHDRGQYSLHFCKKNHCMDKRCKQQYLYTQSRSPLCTHFRGMANTCEDCTIQTYGHKGSFVGENKQKGKSVKLPCSFTQKIE